MCFFINKSTNFPNIFTKKKKTQINYTQNVLTSTLHNFDRFKHSNSRSGQLKQTKVLCVIPGR